MMLMDNGIHLCSKAFLTQIIERQTMARRDKNVIFPE